MKKKKGRILMIVGICLIVLGTIVTGAGMAMYSQKQPTQTVVKQKQDTPTKVPKGTMSKEKFESAVAANKLTTNKTEGKPKHVTFQESAVGEPAKKGGGYAAAITYYEYDSKENAMIAAHHTAENEVRFLKKQGQKDFKETIHAFGKNKAEFIYENKGYYIRAYAAGKRVLYLECYTAQKELMDTVWNDTLNKEPVPMETQPSA